MPRAAAACSVIGVEVRSPLDFDPGATGLAADPACIVASLPPTADKLLEWFGRTTQTHATAEFVFVADRPTLRPAVEAIRCGAIDVLEWPAENGRWEAVLLRACSAAHESAERRAVGAACRRILGELRAGERQVLELMLAGKANKNIATELAIALRTVEARRRRIFEAFRTRSLVSIAEMLRRVRHAASPGPSRPSFFDRSRFARPCDRA